MIINDNNLFFLSNKTNELLIIINSKKRHKNPLKIWIMKQDVNF